MSTHPGRSPIRRVVWLLAASLLGLAIPEASAQCDCYVAFYRSPMTATRYYSFVDSENYSWTQAGKTLVFYASSVWNDYWSEREQNISFEEGGDDIRIVLDETIGGGMAYNYGGGFGEIHINPLSIINQFMVHEFGHMVGLDNTECYKSVMFTNGSQETLTCSDTGGLNNRYHLNESPIIVDIDGDGIQLSSAAHGVRFDIAASDELPKVAWPLSDGDAFLALDRNGNGRIDNGGELFGNHTLLSNGQPAAHGYEALAELDENGDGVLDRWDRSFKRLLLWRDINRNGVSEVGELVTLRSQGIVSISVEPKMSQRVDRWGNRFMYRSIVKADTLPFKRLSFDVYLVRLC